jgi:NAD(P)-dependent dehydrogenase (short-subunit alcohol dehydrogenase family)
MDVGGKTVIITGASRGIGKHTAIELGRRGANVVVAARTVDAHSRLPGTIGETVAAIEDNGGQALAVRVDMASVEDLENLVSQTIERFGGIDVLINNAADTSGGPSTFMDLQRDSFLRQFDVNLHGPFTLVQLAVPSMIERGGGVIINMTSGAGDMIPVPPEPSDRGMLGERVGYSATKASLNRLTNVMAHELKPHNISAFAIDPGFTRTELVDLMGERGIVNPEDAIPMDTPMKTMVYCITEDDAWRYTGEVLRAAAFVAEHDL